MLEPVGIRPVSITVLYGEKNTATVSFEPMTGVVDRLVYSRDGIMVAWAFDQLIVSGGAITLKVDIL